MVLCLARRSPSSHCVFGSYFLNSFDLNIPKILQLLFFMLNSNFLIWNFTIMTCSFYYLVCKPLSLSWYLTGENPESWRGTETPTEGTSRNGKVATSWGKKKVGLPCKTRASLVGTDGLWTFFSYVIFFLAIYNKYCCYIGKKKKMRPWSKLGKIKSKSMPNKWRRWRENAWEKLNGEKGKL